MMSNKAHPLHVASSPSYHPKHALQRRPIVQEKTSPDHPPNNPLSTLELLLLIGSFLDFHSTVMGLRVCRQWHRIFLPKVWTTIKMIYGSQVVGAITTTTQNSPTFEALEKHAPLVRKLIVSSHGNFKLAGGELECRNLSDLILDDTGTIKNEKSMIALVKGHQLMLKSLSSGIQTSPRFLTALEGCVRLERLRLDALVLDEEKEWHDRYDSLWSRLRTFSWTGAILNYPRKAPMDLVADMSFILQQPTSKTTTLHTLHLETLDCKWPLLQAHLLLIVKSPHLTRLDWRVWGRYGLRGATVEDPKLISLLASAGQITRFGQNLESLTLTWLDMTKPDFREVFSSLPALSRLEILRGVVDLGALRVLQSELPQCLSIFKVLNLQLSIQVNGAVVQRILSLMTGLEHFKADYVTDLDILLDNQPWVCTGLKSLHLAIVVLEVVGVSQEIILDRIATMEGLQELNLSMSPLRHRNEPFANPFQQLRDRCLELTMERGLDRLRTLRQLKVFEGPYCERTSWKEAEARWVRDHWGNLTKLQGVMVDRDAERLLPSGVFVPEFIGYW